MDAKILYEDEYITILGDLTHKVFIEDWKPTPKDDDKWKEIKLLGFELIKKYGFEKYLSFTEKSIYVTPPRLHQWFIEEALKQGVNKIVKKAGIVASKDFVVNLGLEMLAHDAVNILHIPVEFFDNREQALEWAMKD
jgi:hypothetical protein